MAWALAYLGSLAFAAFCLWLYRQRVPLDDLKQLRALDGEMRQVKSTVETLAVARGFDPPWVRKTKGA